MIVVVSAIIICSVIVIVKLCIVIVIVLANDIAMASVHVIFQC